MSPFSPIYWRRIKAGARTYSSITDVTVKAEVKDLAKADVVSGEITAEQYAELIGEAYAA
jgi:hypothetical protein